MKMNSQSRKMNRCVAIIVWALALVATGPGVAYGDCPPTSPPDLQQACLMREQQVRQRNAQQVQAELQRQANGKQIGTSEAAQFLRDAIAGDSGAFQRLTEAAIAGNEVAQLNLGKYYVTEGQSPGDDGNSASAYSAAEYWFNKAAKSRVGKVAAEAQDNLRRVDAAIKRQQSEQRAAETNGGQRDSQVGKSSGTLASNGKPRTKAQLEAEIVKLSGGAIRVENDYLYSDYEHDSDVNGEHHHTSVHMKVYLPDLRSVIFDEWLTIIPVDNLPVHWSNVVQPSSGLLGVRTGDASFGHSLVQSHDGLNLPANLDVTGPYEWAGGRDIFKFDLYVPQISNKETVAGDISQLINLSGKVEMGIARRGIKCWKTGIVGEASLNAKNVSTKPMTINMEISQCVNVTFCHKGATAVLGGFQLPPGGAAVHQVTREDSHQDMQFKYVCTGSDGSRVEGFAFVGK